jgi:hypothetical protein
MYPNTMIHRFFLVIGFIYLTMCPHSYDVTEGSFKYSAIGSRVQSLDSRYQRECDTSMPPAVEVCALGGSVAAADSIGLFRHTSEHPHKISTDPLSSIKLRL